MKLSKHISQQKYMKKGFTLIELLIVIAIMGILAAGLLATLDPLEQINKGRDQSRKNVAAQFASATQRYYATYGSFPWGTGVTDFNLTAGTGVISTLISAGELKNSFLSGVPSGKDFQVIAQPVANGGDVYVCFDPVSKSMSQEQTTIYSATTANPPATAATATCATGACYFCAR